MTSRAAGPLNTKILGTGSAFPKNLVTNDDIAKRVDTSDKWIYERTGIRARRIADGSPEEKNSAIATRASLLALEAAGLQASDIDFILFATVSPDHVMPNCASLVQQKLGASKAAALDISAACSGFVYGLGIADSMIRASQAKTVLLIGSEILSPMVDWDDRGTCILFGDGAGAAVLSACHDDSSAVLKTILKADGGLGDLLTADSGKFMKMKGPEIFKVAVKILADLTIETVEGAGMKMEDVDWIVPHQANLRILEAVAKRLGVSMDKFVLNLEEYGNTSSATVPTAFDQAVRDGRIQRGQNVLYNVFGAGLTYGASLLRY